MSDNSESTEAAVGNGFQPFLRIRVRTFTLQDPQRLEPIIWRGSETHHIDSHGSTHYALEGSIRDQDLDAYLDENIPYIVEAMPTTVAGNPYVQIERNTIKAAIEYAKSDTSDVSTPRSPAD